MVIAVGLLLLAPPLLTGSLESARLKASAREVAAALREARLMAIEGQRPVALAIHVEERTYRVDGKRPRKLPSSLQLKVFTAQSEVQGEQAAIRFYPDGSATGGRITLSQDERRYRVDVDWLTGRVHIAE
ncbi:MAG: type II secretion system protein GspH [Gammaproteobacteria bacterium]|nr:MAG: type II secretion system protein GspH [Gammaproteobacteria bacterium]